MKKILNQVKFIFIDDEDDKKNIKESQTDDLSSDKLSSTSSDNISLEDKKISDDR